MMAAAAEAAEAALGRWARAEMELPPVPKSVLRRLCSGSCAPIWDFVTRHVRHPRYRHLEDTEGAGPTPPLGAGLREEVKRLRQEVGGLGGALGEAQEAALELEEKLGAGLARREAWLRRGAELRLLGATAARMGQRLEEGREKLRPPVGKGEGPELEAVLSAGIEPEVLVSVRAVCKMRAESLEEPLEPRPPHEARRRMEAANERWLRAAEELLSRHPPGAVLWALERLAMEAPPPPTKEEPLSDPELDPEAPPTVQSLLQECWGAVGGLWGRLPPPSSSCPPPPSPLTQLWNRLLPRLGGDPKTQQAARLALTVAGLEGARGGLLRGVKELRDFGGGAAPPSPDPSPGKLRQKLRRKRLRMLRSRRRLQALLGASRGRLRPLQERVRGVAQAGLGSAPLALAGEGERLRQVLGELGRLGALGEPPHGPSPDPLAPVARALGLPRYQDPEGGLLPRAAALRAELREGAWLRKGAWSPPPSLLPLPLPLGGGAEAQLLPRLRLVAARIRARIEAWPRLQALVSQWWEQPAQWTLAPPPGSLPFSHWLQRWSRAAQALAPPPMPRPLPEATPTPEEGEDNEEWAGLSQATPLP